MKKKYFIFLLITLALYFLTIRGSVGVPTPEDVDQKLNSSGQPFETSQERSRYALILSLYYDKTFSIDNYASMGTPDIGFIKGHYYSFFPPAVSILALPLYTLGLKINATQIATFLLPTIFAVLTTLMMIKFLLRFDVHWTVAFFSALAFGFATNAWGYSVTLYAHLVSAFLILAGLYVTTSSTIKSWLAGILVWVLYACAVFVDFPNLFVFLPLALIFTFGGFQISQRGKEVKIRYKWLYILTPLIFVIFMAFYGYYNYVHFGSPAILSNAIPRVRDLKKIELKIPEAGKSTIGAFKTHLILEGLRSFIVSTDRGIIFYSPVILLSLFMVLGSYGSLDKKTKIGLVAIPSVCLTLYAMFGDPYGGWAFGSRYLIAVMPELCILAGFALDFLWKNKLIRIIFTLIFLYSVGVSLLAPLTTNVIPPEIEARDLGLKHDYTINIEMLSKNKLNSFAYNHILNKSVSGWVYYGFIYSVVAISGITLVWLPKGKYEN